MAAEAATISATVLQTSERRQFQHVFPEVIPFTFKLLEATIASAAVSSGDITVTGAALGDFVLFASEYDSADLTISGQVTAANTVTISLSNLTGGAVTQYATTARKFNGVILKAGELFV
jgi:hypothetical protein